MKRFQILWIAAVILFMTSIAGAQSRGDTSVKTQFSGTIGRYNAALAGAWWTNKATLTRLGATDDQKARLDAAYEHHKQDLATDTAALEKEEIQLNMLLQADPVNQNAIYSEIDRVIQARGDLERVNSVMTLEMRTVLTKAQWTQLNPQTNVTPGDSGTPNLLRIGGNVAAANLTNAPKPNYPPLALQARVQGTVILETRVDSNGSVADIRVISGHPLLTAAAISAVQQYRYTPILLNGQPTPFITTVEVNFSLPE